MNQEIQPLFEVDAMKVGVGNMPDPEVAALPKRRGPKPDLTKAESRRVEALEREITRL
jgi:hypothetical protein